jgi:hypothetical protein
MPQSSPRDDFFEADTPDSTTDRPHIRRHLHRRPGAACDRPETLVLTLQRFLGQGLTICLTLPGPPQPSGTHLLLAGLPVHSCGKPTMTQSPSL